MLGIDFGERRVGLAISDEDGRVVTPLVTLERRDDRRLIRRIAEIAAQEAVGTLVVGEPVNVDGSRGPAAERVRRFASKLATTTGLETLLVNESLTSVAARERLREAGVDLRRHPERIDAVAAQILLEDALAQERPA
jgi:putative Holliday junction resolvase